MITALGLSPNLFFWPNLILSESVSIAVTNIIAALIISNIHRKIKISHTLLILILILFFSHLRDANLYLTFFIVPFLLYISRWRKNNWLLAIIVVPVIANFFVQSYMIREGNRGKLPLANVLYTRVFPFEQRTDWFLKEGMPADSQLIHNMTGKWAFDAGYGSELFNKYLENEGQADYKKFLLYNFSYTYNALKENYVLALNKSLVFYSFLPREDKIWLEDINTWTWPNYEIFLPFWGLLCIILLIKREFLKLAGLTLIFIAFYSNLLVCFHGDAYEVARHTLIPAYIFRMFSLLVILLLIDYMIRFIKHPRKPVPLLSPK